MYKKNLKEWSKILHRKAVQNDYTITADVLIDRQDCAYIAYTLDELIDLVENLIDGADEYWSEYAGAETIRKTLELIGEEDK